MKNINKILILGGPGSGKTTLAKKIGERYNLPTYHIDGIHHLENWKIRDKEERDKIILKITEKPKWVIDGNYKSTLSERVKKCDLIIYLKYPTIIRVKGIFQRYLKGKGKEKAEIPGCEEKMSFKFIIHTINWNKKKGNTIEDILNKYPDKEIKIFRNRRELNNWWRQELRLP